MQSTAYVDVQNLVHCAVARPNAGDPFFPSPVIT